MVSEDVDVPPEPVRVGCQFQSRAPFADGGAINLVLRTGRAYAAQSGGHEMSDEEDQD